ncbi:hypothetical protein V757_01950 [Pelistega indica]|uniref:Uncharacterized protein n=1 Tax=Pelistega indica TaxID=1414851 RepID=V8G9N9_9BURK|nr:hypothetical protein [Pelistega indica]ETD72826.1 hypothetical protein V757_01950 [Pelistega indica]
MSQVSTQTKQQKNLGVLTDVKTELTNASATASIKNLKNKTSYKSS